MRKKKKASVIVPADNVETGPGQPEGGLVPSACGEAAGICPEGASRSVSGDDDRREDREAPLVSVIIPVFNAEKYLRQCLDSVIGQTLRDIEILCVDDGSTDGSPAILEEYRAADPRVGILWQENRYAGVARNAGMDTARGKYLAFLDADDFFEPTLLEKQAAQCEKTGADVCVCGAGQYDMRRNVTEPMPWALRIPELPGPVFSAEEMGDEIFRFTTPAPWNKLFRAGFIRKTGLRFQATRQTNDAYFVLCALNLAGAVSFVDEALVHYRTGTETSLQANNDRAPTDFIKALEAIRERLIRDGLYEKRKTGYIRRAFSMCSYNLSTMAADDPACLRLAETLRGSVVPGLAAEVGEEALSRMEEYKTLAFRLYGSAYAKVSVVVPIYNSAPWLRKCLDSLVDQTLRELQIVCVIDGSTDDSESIVREYAARDDRIRIVCQENRGLSAARNAGAACAEGEYLCFLDSDDYLEKDALRYLYAESEKNGLDMLLFDGESFLDLAGSEQRFSGDDYCTRKKEYHEVYAGEDLYTRMRNDGTYRPMAWLAFFLTAYYRRAKLGFREGILHEDILFSAQAILSAGRISHRKKTLYHYRRRADSITGGRGNAGNVYGRFVSLAGLVFLLQKGGYGSEVCRSTHRYLQYLREEIVKGYDGLASFEKEAMPRMTKLQQIAFAEVLGEPHTWELPRPTTEEDFESESYLLNGHRYGIASPPKTAGEETPMFVRIGRLRETGAFFPDVSIVVPVYNTGMYLRECLDSALGQTLKNIEIICVNDGSRDDSLAILEKAAEADPRVSVISQKNGGQSAARNAGVGIARGKYLYFLDSDDLIRPDAMELLWSRAEDHELDLLLFDADTIFENEAMKTKFPQYENYYLSRHEMTGVHKGEELFSERIKNGEYRCQPCLQFIRREYYEKAGIRFEEGIIQEDNLSSFLTIFQARRAEHIPEKLFIRRIRANSTMTVPFGFRNFYGLLRCGMGIMRFLADRRIQDEAEQLGSQLAQSLFRQAISIKDSMPYMERRKLKDLQPEEYMWMRCAELMK